MDEYYTCPAIQLPEPDPIASRVNDLVKLTEAHDCTSSKAVKEILEMTMHMIMDQIEATIYPTVESGQVLQIVKP